MYPDRLWYFDHQDAPNNTAETWWAMSNDNGNAPAFWTAIAPFNLTDEAQPDLVDEHVSDSLERRLPSFLDFYQNNRCSGYRIDRCNGIFRGTCCSNRSGFNSRAIDIPSVSPGDILAIFSTRSCSGRNTAGTVLYGFAGCWAANRGSFINSVLLNSCTRC